MFLWSELNIYRWCTSPENYSWKAANKRRKHRKPHYHIQFKWFWWICTQLNACISNGYVLQWSQDSSNSHIWAFYILLLWPSYNDEVWTLFRKSKIQWKSSVPSEEIRDGELPFSEPRSSSDLKAYLRFMAWPFFLSTFSTFYMS